MEEINISKFKLRNINPISKIHIIGRRACGKTTVIKNLMANHLYAFNKMIVFTDYTQTYEGINLNFNSVSIMDNYNETFLMDKWTLHKKNVQKKGRLDSEKLLIIVDDCSVDINKSKTLKEIMMNGRSYNCGFIYSTQYFNGVSPALRTNFDYVFCFRDINKNNTSKLYSSYFRAFNTFDMFDKVYFALTEHYQCLVLNNHKFSNKIEDCVFWYKSVINKDDRGNNKSDENEICNAILSLNLV